MSVLENYQNFLVLTKRYIADNILLPDHVYKLQGNMKKAEAKIPDFGVKHQSRSGQEPESGIAVRSKVWLEKDGKLLMGSGRVKLLEQIDQLGSISAAARSMKLAYRNAWLWVEAMNRLAPSPLVEKATGGPHGGYTRLTDAGRRIIKEYREKRARVRKILK
jgi:molybdate transport system regulatory protein